MIHMLEQIAYGIITGVVYAAAGWQSQVKKDDKNFDWKKLGKSVAICGIVGGIAQYTNQDFNMVITGGLGIGVTKAATVLWNLGKAYIAKLKKKK